MGYVLKVYLARVLGAEALGIYALGMTLIGFLGVFNTLGLTQSAVRFVAAYNATGNFAQLHAFLWRGAAFLLAANAFFAAILLIFGRLIAAHFYHSPVLVQYLPWFALIMLFSVMAGFYGKVLAGYRDLARRTLIVNFVGGPFVMLAGVLLVWNGLGLRGYLVAQVIGSAISMVLLILVVRELTPAAARFLSHRGSSLEREVWTFSAAMLGIGLMEFLMVHIDRVALGFYMKASDVGVYSVAAAVVAYVPMVLLSVNQIFSPTISDLHTRGDRALLGRLFQSLTKWVIGLTLPLAAVVIVFAQPMMRIFGHDFESGWPILVIGTIGQLVNCGVGSVGFLLLMSGNERRLIKIQSVMAVVMVILNIVLVPVWGVTGAALAAAITNVGVNIWNLLEVRSVLKLSPYNASYFRLLPPIAAVVGMTILLKMRSEVFHHDWLSVCVAGVVAYVVFAAGIFLMGLDADDRLIADAIRGRIRGIFGKPVSATL
jgi:O-antigen/teichoic acid export membrane protein